MIPYRESSWSQQRRKNPIDELFSKLSSRMSLSLCIRLCVVSAWPFLISSAQAQIIIADTQAFAAPDPASRALTHFRAGAFVKILKRDGFWVEVESGGVKGWVRISSVKFSAGSGTTSIDTGRLGTGNIVATSAARGLSAKDLLEGKGDPKAVDKLNAHRVEVQQIIKFAQEGNLTEVKLTAFLQVPSPDSAGSRQIVRKKTATQEQNEPTPSSRPQRTGKRAADADW